MSLSDRIDWPGLTGFLKQQHSRKSGLRLETRVVINRGSRVAKVILRDTATGSEKCVPMAESTLRDLGLLREESAL